MGVYTPSHQQRIKQNTEQYGVNVFLQICEPAHLGVQVLIPGATLKS